MTTITLNRVSKSFEGGIIAVDDVSLQITSGDVLAILGPSSSGKSTLLRLIAGTLKPDSGEVFYGQSNLKDIALRDRGIGMVFQEGALMPQWIAQRSVDFWSRLRNREDEIPERIRRISKITGIGLDKLLGRRPKQLSGGEQQRVSIARALARDMRLLLFDEPFANLDAKFRAEARVELKRLLQEFPATTVYVTHDQTEAVALSHRIAVMRAGKLEQIGTYHDLYTRPINLFVAEFIGIPTINLFLGYTENGQWHGENFGGYPIRRDLSDGTKVAMGIRPEFIRLEDGGIPAVVDIATPFYAERQWLLELRLAKERWQMILPLDQKVEVGTTIYCGLDPEGILYFNPRTGKRIG